MDSIKDTKQKLLYVTRQMIDESGVESVSMRELGKNINLSRSAVYRYFSSKEHLLSAIIVEDFVKLKDTFTAEIKKIPNIEEQIKTILHSFYDFGITNKQHYNLMFTKEWSKDKYPAVHEVSYDVFCLFAACIYKGQQEKKIIEKPNNELVAIIYSYIHGLIQLNLAGHYEPEKGLSDSHQLIESFYKMIRVR